MSAIETSPSQSAAFAAENLVSGIRTSKKLLLRSKILIGDLRQLRFERQINSIKSKRLLAQGRLIAEQHAQCKGEALAVLDTVTSLSGQPKREPV